MTSGTTASVETDRPKPIAYARLRLSYALQVCGIGLVPRVGVKRILKVLTYVAAGLYLLVDAMFMTLAKPIADWIGEHVALRRLGD